MHVEMTNIMKFISISRLFIYIIVGKLYSRVVLILGGLRYVWVGGGVRKGGSIHSAIKMNMVQE